MASVSGNTGWTSLKRQCAAGGCPFSGVRKPAKYRGYASGDH